MKKFLMLLAAFCCSISVALAVDVKPTILDPVANKRVVEIASQLRCLVCQNQSIADSNAELAIDLKNQVVKQIAAGKTNQEIIDFMVERYGDFVLYKPPFKMSTALLWLGPLLFALVAIGTLFWTLAKRRKVVVAPLSQEERKRAEILLSGQTNSKGRRTHQ